MPRPVRTRPQATAFIASAARIGAGKTAGAPKGARSADWQAEAWTMRDTVGELRFADSWLANSLSRVKLYVAEELPGGEFRRVEAGLPKDALDAFFYGEDGQRQMLSAMGSHFLTPGETWVAGLADPPADESIDQWRVLSNDEIKREADEWVIDRGDGNPERYRAKADENGNVQLLPIRLWRPHPRKSMEADSPVRAALPILRELVGLTKKIAADIDSRLSGAGIFTVPSEATFATPQNESVDPTQAGQSQANELVRMLTQAMATAIRDRGSAEANVPIILQAPGALLSGFQHITFSTPLDEKALELRAEGIRRLALSLDMPPEVLLGQADSNHWSAWQISEEGIKTHIEPLVELLTAGLTSKFLWPILQGDAVSMDPALRRFTIVGDTSELRIRPQRSAEAIQLHADLKINDAALVRETGFGTEDLLDPTSQEYRLRVLQRVALAAVTPDVSLAALHQLGAMLTPEQASVGTPSPGAPAAGGSDAPTPAVEAPRNPPQQQALRAAVAADDDLVTIAALSAPPDQQQRVALTLGCEGIVQRALERAKGRLGKRGHLDSVKVQAALHDAWERVPRVAAMCGVVPEQLEHALWAHTTRVLRARGQEAELEPAALDTVIDGVLPRA